MYSFSGIRSIEHALMDLTTPITNYKARLLPEIAVASSHGRLQGCSEDFYS